MLDREYDLIVVGAGILGSALAASLSRKNYKTLLIERDLREPDRIVGELLQPGGVAALKTLGLEGCLEGIDAVRVDGYQCIYHGESVAIPYPDGHTGRSFHHGRFVQNLRKAAQASPATVIEATVAKVIENPQTEQVMGVKTSDGRHFFAPLTIIADGCFSKFRRDFVPHKPVTRSNFVALLLDNADIPAPNHGHVILSDVSPILVYQISTHDTRMLIDIQGSLPSLSSGKMIPFLKDTILPQIPEQLKPAVSAAIESGQRIRHMPNSFLPPSTNSRDGVMLLGDAMNMRHPLTGGGMTVALKDVVLINELLRTDSQDKTKLHELEKLRRLKHEFHWSRKSRGSSTINVLAQALYSLFALPQPAAGEDAKDNSATSADNRDGSASQLRVLQEGCFRYFQLGGACVSGPVGFLSGITPSPIMLFLHFFAVAIYAIYLMFRTNLGFPASRTASPIQTRTQASDDVRDGVKRTLLKGPTTAAPVPNATHQNDLTTTTTTTTNSIVSDRTKRRKETSTGSKGKNRSALGIPIALLTSTVQGAKVLWTACLVLFPVLFSELRA